MTKPITDAELEQRIYSEIPVMLAEKGLSDEQYNAIMDDRKDSVELIMRLVKEYAIAHADEVVKQKQAELLRAGIDAGLSAELERISRDRKGRQP